MATITPAYSQCLGDLKTRYRQVQLKAAVAVNTAMLQFYWELGADIAAQQGKHAWGSGFLAQLSAGQSTPIAKQAASQFDGDNSKETRNG
ncbi:DUF1016 N-terminal domain-containing protein [Simplicispira psychrophila]|uniref:DUF1016 N-terminal domain-containing protein n=1 Tax=Simplicispira psychrophila TaxID=80882 RepID=UPI000567A37A|nr:DUF1016 N-terminal domain-containing protein [Simplicispira psychrophila]